MKILVLKQPFLRFAAQQLLHQLLLQHLLQILSIAGDLIPVVRSDITVVVQEQLFPVNQPLIQTQHVFVCKILQLQRHQPDAIMILAHRLNVLPEWHALKYAYRQQFVLLQHQPDAIMTLVHRLNALSEWLVLKYVHQD